MSNPHYPEPTFQRHPFFIDGFDPYIPIQKFLDHPITAMPIIRLAYGPTTPHDGPVEDSIISLPSNLRTEEISDTVLNDLNGTNLASVLYAAFSINPSLSRITRDRSKALAEEILSGRLSINDYLTTIRSARSIVAQPSREDLLSALTSLNRETPFVIRNHRIVFFSPAVSIPFQRGEETVNVPYGPFFFCLKLGTTSVDVRAIPTQHTPIYRITDNEEHCSIHPHITTFELAGGRELLDHQPLQVCLGDESGVISESQDKWDILGLANSLYNLMLTYNHASPYAQPDRISQIGNQNRPVTNTCPGCNRSLAGSTFDICPYCSAQGVIGGRAFYIPYLRTGTQGTLNPGLIDDYVLHTMHGPVRFPPGTGASLLKYSSKDKEAFAFAVNDLKRSLLFGSDSGRAVTPLQSLEDIFGIPYLEAMKILDVEQVTSDFEDEDGDLVDVWTIVSEDIDAYRCGDDWSEEFVNPQFTAALQRNICDFIAQAVPFAKLFLETTGPSRPLSGLELATVTGKAIDHDSLITLTTELFDHVEQSQSVQPQPDPKYYLEMARPKAFDPADEESVRAFLESAIESYSVSTDDAEGFVAEHDSGEGPAGPAGNDTPPRIPSPLVPDIQPVQF